MHSRIERLQPPQRTVEDLYDRVCSLIANKEEFFDNNQIPAKRKLIADLRAALESPGGIPLHQLNNLSTRVADFEANIRKTTERVQLKQARLDREDAFPKFKQWGAVR